MRRPWIWLSTAAVALACGQDAPAPQLGSVLNRQATLGDFLSRHWTIPLEPQGPPPEGFSEAEASLQPEMCGACHPLQHAQWRNSLHAGAYSPGLAGQLIEGNLSHPLQVRSCNSCHAPLAEQQPYTAALSDNPDFDPELQAHGLTCAGCHVRAHRRYGPPPRPDAPPTPEPVPHNGFEVRAEYLESRFCAECHQFFDDPGVNGKPIENTYAEWLASPQAAAGRHCQDCHMPDRAHHWRGIHDRGTVRAAVDVELVSQPAEAGGAPALALLVRNRDVGHAFPTYVTPRVFLSIEQVDAAERPLPETRLEAVIAREVDLAQGIERFDTRVLPGESVRLDYAIKPHPEAVAYVARVTIDPDYHYRDLFAYLLQTLTDDRARGLISEAARRIADSTYELTELRRAVTEN